MNANVLPAALGLLLVCGVGVYFAMRQADPEPAEHTSRTALNTEAEREAERLREENANLRKRVAELEDAARAPKKVKPKVPVAKEPNPDAELTDEDIENGLKRFGRSFQKIVAGTAQKEVAALRDLIKRGGPKVLEKVTSLWADTSSGVMERVVAAHILANSGDAKSIELLTTTLRDPDRGTFEHRFAAHALAFADIEGIEPLLLEVARNNKDSGAAANAAFGLARRGIDEGVKLYMSATDEAFNQGQAEAIAYLSGLPMIGDKAKPYVRERLLTYKSESGLLSLIEIVKGFKDKDALPQLNKLAYDASRPVSIQNAAKGAIKALTKKAPAK